MVRRERTRCIEPWKPLLPRSFPHLIIGCSLAVDFAFHRMGRVELYNLNPLNPDENPNAWKTRRMVRFG